MSETCFRIFNDNYADIDVLANTYVSSEDVNFPLANAFNQQRRSKVWRTAGYFKVTTENNKLRFFSYPLSWDIEVTPGEYTTPAALAAEIETQMTLAYGSDDFTVSHNGSRFSITSTIHNFGLVGSGNSGTLYELIGLSGGPGEMLEDRIHDYEFITFDMGLPTNPDAFIMTDQRNDVIKISPEATIKLQASHTNTFDNPPVDITLSYDDNIIAALSEDGLASEPYRYWRLYIQDRANPNGYIQLGAFFLGNFFKPARGRVQFNLDQSYQDRSTKIFSEGGQIFTDIKEQSGVYRISWSGLQKSDIEELDRFFKSFGIGKPFFMSLDSDSNFSSVFNRRIIFCYFDAAPTWSLQRPDYFNFNMNVREAL